MAFPWTTEENFEAGTIDRDTLTDTHFDASADTESRLDVPHYTELARYPHTHTTMPYRGAYCLRVALENDGTPADAYLQEEDSWDMTAGSAELYVRFMLWLSPDTVMATTNEFKVLDFWSSTNTPEAGVMVNYTTANGYRIGIGKATASQFKPLTLGKWHCVEVFFDPAGSSNGTIDAWLDGSAFTQVTGLTNASITSGVFGVIGQDAGTTAGTLLLDELVTDDERIFPTVKQYQETLLLTKSSHVFVGPGRIDQITLLSGAAADNVCSVFDTDQGYVSDSYNIASEIGNDVASKSVMEIDINVTRGAYVELSGTNPRALVKIGKVQCMSDGGLRAYSRARSPNPLGA